MLQIPISKEHTDFLYPHRGLFTLIKSLADDLKMRDFSLGGVSVEFVDNICPSL